MPRLLVPFLVFLLLPSVLSAQGADDPRPDVPWGAEVRVKISNPALEGGDSWLTGRAVETTEQCQFVQLDHIRSEGDTLVVDLKSQPGDGVLMPIGSITTIEIRSTSSEGEAEEWVEASLDKYRARQPKSCEWGW